MVGWIGRRIRKRNSLGFGTEVIRDQGLTFHGERKFLGAKPVCGGWGVETSEGKVWTRNLCMAVGRRGSPRQLAVPGAELEKVRTALLDPREHRGERVLVVGGGDSAVEAALVLALQEGTDVTLAYRGSEFWRPEARNRLALEQAQAEGRVRVLMDTELTRIAPDRVWLDGEKEVEKRLCVLPCSGVRPRLLPWRSLGFPLIPRNGWRRWSRGAGDKLFCAGWSWFGFWPWWVRFGFGGIGTTIGCP